MWLGTGDGLRVKGGQRGRVQGGKGGRLRVVGKGVGKGERVVGEGLRMEKGGGKRGKG